MKNEETETAFKVLVVIMVMVLPTFRTSSPEVSDNETVRKPTWWEQSESCDKPQASRFDQKTTVKTFLNIQWNFYTVHR